MYQIRGVPAPLCNQYPQTLCISNVYRAHPKLDCWHLVLRNLLPLPLGKGRYYRHASRGSWRLASVLSGWGYSSDCINISGVTNSEQGPLSPGPIGRQPPHIHQRAILCKIGCCLAYSQLAENSFTRTFDEQARFAPVLVR